MDNLDFSIRLRIAEFAPIMLCLFRDLWKVRRRVVCPYHKNSVIYGSKCKVCGFVRRLSPAECDRLFFRKLGWKRRRVARTTGSTAAR